jgi:hypothetical protein
MDLSVLTIGDCPQQRVCRICIVHNSELVVLLSVWRLTALHSASPAITHWLIDTNLML